MNDSQNLNIRGLTADRLRTLYYVAQTQSATKAAQKLFLCQSAVTKQIQQIEDDLGFMVFYRRDRKFFLTSMGERIYELAQRTLHDIDGTLKSLKEKYEGDLAGSLKILTFPSFATIMAPRYLKGFNDKYPDITLKIATCYESMPIHGADMAIRAYTPNQPDLEQIVLYREHYALYASEEYIAQNGLPKTLEDLDRHKLLAIDDDWESYYPDLNWILKVGTNEKANYRKASMYFPSNDALGQAVVAGMGIAGLVTHHVHALNNPSIVHVISDYTIERNPVCLIYNKNVENKSKYEALKDYLLESLKRDGICYSPEK